ncbi:hypothetical protein FHS96_004361 [Sphingomonas zeicaulis]|uniref:hypothetical protein n=1 Tax=Sphingomonas zeicaulis TaxID=1632740 RepID=UPI003D2373AE
MVRILCLATPLVLLGACSETGHGPAVPHEVGLSADDVEAYGLERALALQPDGGNSDGGDDAATQEQADMIAAEAPTARPRCAPVEQWCGREAVPVIRSGQSRL